MTKTSKKLAATQTVSASTNLENMVAIANNQTVLTLDSIDAMRNEFLNISKSFENIFTILSTTNFASSTQTSMPSNHESEKAVKGKDINAIFNF